LGIKGEKVMLFASMTFLWIFLPVLLCIYYISKGKLRNIILLIFSLIFYSWGEPKYVFLMLFSIFINYIFGLIIDKSHKKLKKLVLFIAVIANLGLLAYFKYFNFIVVSINKILQMDKFAIRDIALPIGISFYTFQVMSYIIDLYKGEIKVQKNPLNLALYISLFPQLIAGPIVKYHDIQKQINERIVTVEKFAEGVKRFAIGLAKKVLISNTLALVADTMFDGDILSLSAPHAWLGIICYTFQIYYDFSGYSDMAIGLGKMFGFEFLENFNLPYIAQSITEFWRRWHISLSSWFKQYLYIPLGGNRKGKIRTYINLIIVFFATGLWHGASWNFVLWGLFHGFFMLIERIKLKELLDKNKFKVLNHIYTLAVVMFGWVFFRADGLRRALRYIKVLFTGGLIDGLELSNIINFKLYLVLAIAILFSGPIQKLLPKKGKRRVLEPVGVFVLMLLCIMTLVSNTYNPFIYFRF